ncbi:hypothetical protein GWK47_012168 [Chionoecetes opilio]|uniref:Chitin-binding type-2 domain-containing protein n=1 Tax=Chionoecetes opilio TaxID=41210 RepID=A0A8J4XW91_CHIOP|nr:hypothetical protein GWK47_012168 [Chionoecetes opilio]
MAATSCWIVMLAAIIGATDVLAAKPGPNNIRYPDEIVKPKVTCGMEGVFPHPRSCNWYYRCVDRMNIGRYWTYYFECEPGTVFSDELDQCIHPFMVKGPCGNQPITTPRTTPPTTTITTTRPTISCQGVEGTCRLYEVCQPKAHTRYFCDRIRCPLRTPELACADGYSFDMDARVCAKLPEASTLCNATTTINITEAGEVPCSADNLRPSSEFIIRLYCDTYVLCDKNGRYSGRKELCRNYYECQRDGNSWKAYMRSCPPNLLYSYTMDKCESKPTGKVFKLVMPIKL